MNPNKYRFEEGYSSPIKYNWLIGEIELDFFKEWIPEGRNSTKTRLRIEVEGHEISEAASRTIETLIKNQNQFSKEIAFQILYYYLEELYPEIEENKEWLKLNPPPAHLAPDFEAFPELQQTDIKEVKKYNFLAEIYIPLQITEGIFGVVIDSQWEEEHGIGLAFKDYKFYSIEQSELASDFENPEKEIIKQEQLKKGIVLPYPPPIYKHLPDLDYVVHWEWNSKLNRYQVIKKMKGEFGKNEVEIK